MLNSALREATGAIGQAAILYVGKVARAGRIQGIFAQKALIG